MLGWSTVVGVRLIILIGLVGEGTALGMHAMAASFSDQYCVTKKRRCMQLGGQASGWRWRFCFREGSHTETERYETRSTISGAGSMTTMTWLDRFEMCIAVEISACEDVTDVHVRGHSKQARAEAVERTEQSGNPFPATPCQTNIHFAWMRMH
jgi:hypothetical protein